VFLEYREHKTIFGKNNECINNKVCAALRNSLLPILRIGETEKCLKSVSHEQAETFRIAYEPVWAISISKSQPQKTV
jgi:triosephosphate isomerase